MVNPLHVFPLKRHSKVLSGGEQRCDNQRAGRSCARGHDELDDGRKEGQFEAGEENVRVARFRIDDHGGQLDQLAARHGGPLDKQPAGRLDCAPCPAVSAMLVRQKMPQGEGIRSGQGRARGAGELVRVDVEALRGGALPASMKEVS